MTRLPVQTVRRLYDDQTLSVIEGVLGGVAFDQSSDPIASQSIDPMLWRSMHKGALLIPKTVELEQRWALARAIAYDRYLPTVVLTRAQSLLRMIGSGGPVEVVYFPDAIGILYRDALRKLGATARERIEAHMCLVTRDITRPSDFIRRRETFERTVSHWRDHLVAAGATCDRLALPPIESLARDAQPCPPLEWLRGKR